MFFSFPVTMEGRQCLCGFSNGNKPCIYSRALPRPLPLYDEYVVEFQGSHSGENQQVCVSAWLRVYGCIMHVNMYACILSEMKNTCSAFGHYRKQKRAIGYCHIRTVYHVRVRA